jgi:hypothetical protein
VCDVERVHGDPKGLFPKLLSGIFFVVYGVLKADWAATFRTDVKEYTKRVKELTLGVSLF